MQNISKRGNTPYQAITLKGCWQKVPIRNYS